MNGIDIRPATLADLDALAGLLAPGLSDQLALGDGDEDERLWLAIAGGRPVAAMRARRRIGLSDPRCWFHLGCRVHAAPDLGMFRRERTLLLGNDHTGAAELGDFAIEPGLVDRPGAIEAATRLVGAALDWLRERPRQADEIDRVIAALPGPRAADGSSPFWNGLGRHFYKGDVDQLRMRFGESWESHLAALLPRHPLVVSILDEASQQAIGAVHPAAAVWRSALLATGLRAGQHVAIHDGGPVHEAHLGAASA